MELEELNKDKGFRRYKLIYSGELLLIAVVFLVLGILKLVGIMMSKQPRMLVFNIITTLGGLWIIIDLIWILVSPKRRKKNCLLDKLLNLPIALCVLPFNVYNFITYPGDNIFFNYFVGGMFLYVFINYTFQAIYHFYKPVPAIILAYQEELVEKEKALEEARNKVEQEELNERKDNEE